MYEKEERTPRNEDKQKLLEPIQRAFEEAQNQIYQLTGEAEPELEAAKAQF